MSIDHAKIEERRRQDMELSISDEPIDLRSAHRYCVSCKSESCLEEIRLEFGCESREVTLAWVNDLIVIAYQCSECNVKAQERNEKEKRREYLARIRWECRD